MVQSQRVQIFSAQQQEKKDKSLKKSATFLHLKKYKGLVEWISYVLSSPIVSYCLILFIAVLGVVKQYLVDSPSAPFFTQEAYRLALIILKRLDKCVDKLFLRDGLDAFYEQFSGHDHKFGAWTLYFVLDFAANILNYIIKSILPVEITETIEANDAESVETVAGNEGDLKSVVSSVEVTESMYPELSSEFQSSSAKLSLINNELPHVHELTDTTSAIRKDISGKYIAPTKSMIESYLEPTKTKIEAQYFKPLNNKVESTKNIINSKYKEACEVISKTRESGLNALEDPAKNILSTGVDLGSRAFSCVKSLPKTADLSPSILETTLTDEINLAANENQEMIA